MGRIPVTPRVRRRAKASPTLERLARDVAARTLAPGTRKSRSAAATTAHRIPRPGELRSIPHLKRADAQRLFRAALLRACGGTTRAAERGILWRDGDDELILHAGRATLATAERLIVVSFAIYTDQTGETEVVIPFVTSPGESALGLIAGTETLPRGPAAVIDIFGEMLVAVTWAALVEVAAAWAGAAGEATGNGRLAPAGLSATKAAVLVSAQVRFESEDR